MKLEECFEFETFQSKFGPVERIRIKGHRIAIEHVIEQFKAGNEPQAIVRDSYPSLTVEEVYAAITYYLLNKAAMDKYLAAGVRIGDAYYQEYLQRGPDFLRDDANGNSAAPPQTGTTNEPAA